MKRDRKNVTARGLTPKMTPKKDAHLLGTISTVLGIDPELDMAIEVAKKQTDSIYDKCCCTDIVSKVYCVADILHQCITDSYLVHLVDITDPVFYKLQLEFLIGQMELSLDSKCNKS